jgi:uncharacterized protein with HEPN domain
MSSKDPKGRLLDIVENIDGIDEYTVWMDEAAFRRDHRTLDATERCLERIAEAVIKIGHEQMARIAPDLPIERVRGLGNLMRHAYDDVDPEVIFRVIRNELPALKRAAMQALET